jgi:hypothetical protein
MIYIGRKSLHTDYRQQTTDDSLIFSSIGLILLFFLPRLSLISNPSAHAEMEIKIKLDTEKVAKATVAIAASYGLTQVSEGTKYPQLAFTNAIALIAIIAILYSPRLALKAK